MFTRILVGIDGEEGGRDALALALAFSASAQTEVVLAHVWERAAGVAAAATGAEHPAKAAHELLENVRRGLPSWCRTVVRAAGSPGGGLHVLAEEEGCDLIVVGSSTVQRLGRVHLTRDLRTALHGAPCAIAVAPRGYAAGGRPIEVVGVGLTEDDLGDDALAEAREIARAQSAELHVMTVVPPLPSPWLGGPFAYLAVFDDITGRNVRDTRERLEARGGLVVSVEKGTPHPCLRDFSATVDLLVLGSRAYGPVRRTLLGSTSDAVVRDAACPVLILPRPVLEPSASAAGAEADPVPTP